MEVADALADGGAPPASADTKTASLRERALCLPSRLGKHVDLDVIVTCNDQRMKSGNQSSS